MTSWATVPIAQVPPTAALVFGADTNGDAQFLALEPVNLDRPAVLVDGVMSPTAAVGAVLTCTTGNWAGTPTTYAYQWTRGVTTIGTNSNSYTTVAGDVGGTIRCTVTATNAEGSTAGPTSNGVAVS